MGLDPTLLATFRADLRRCREKDDMAWAVSSRLVGRATLHTTIQQIIQAIKTSPQPIPVQESLLACFRQVATTGAEPFSADQLKHLTGLPAHKALRALCVLFGIAKTTAGPQHISSLTPTQVEEYVRTHNTPYDLLLDSDVASLLDLGAGDLSFAAELAEQYVGRLRAQHKELTLHGIERLKPGSKLGSVLHADQPSLQRLQRATPGLQFRFWGDLDMFDLDKASGLCPRYTIVTCQAPPTPTFAYEPSRVSHHTIEHHLRRTKGDYRTVRVEGEEALEVIHGGRSLLFPAWKFEIRGPLALLDLVARRGKLCVLAAVDTEVFWETLSQLVADERMRPPDLLFTPATLPDVFGTLYTELSKLPLGTRLDLSKVTDLRQGLPRVLQVPQHMGPSYHFRYVELRRGAVFEGIPASRTARLFKDMTEEAPPWLLLLIPDC